MKSFLHTDNGPSRNASAFSPVESTFFQTKPVYLDKIFFNEAFSFPRGRGLPHRLAAFDRYQDYSFEFLRLKTLSNYHYITHGRFYHMLYHYNIYSQFRMAYLFFRSSILSSTEIALPYDDLLFQSRDLIFYQDFFFTKTQSSLPFDVISGSVEDFQNFTLSYFDLEAFQAQLTCQLWENPKYAFFTKNQHYSSEFDDLYNPVLTDQEWLDFYEQFKYGPGVNFSQDLETMTNDDFLMYEALENSASEDVSAEAEFSLPYLSEFSSKVSHQINYTFAYGVSEFSHYWRFFFFPSIALVSVSPEARWFYKFLKVPDPRLNNIVRPSTRNLSLHPGDLYSGFPGSLLSGNDFELTRFLSSYAKLALPKRRRRRLATGKGKSKRSSEEEEEALEPDTFDTIIDSSSAELWDTSSLPQFIDGSSSGPEDESVNSPLKPINYAWPYSLGDFSILYSQEPFLKKHVSDILGNFTFDFQYSLRPPFPQQPFHLPYKIEFPPAVDNVNFVYSSLIHLPNFWRAATYPFQQNDISEYYYFYNNKFASTWMPFKSDTYSYFVLNYYPIFLSSDAFLLRNARRRYALSLRPVPPTFNISSTRFDFGLPIVAKQFGFSKNVSHSPAESASFELLKYLRGMKYFYFFYIDSFIRSVTHFFSFIVPYFFKFFDSSADFQHLVKFYVIPMLYDRAPFHNFFFYVVKLDQFFYLTNGWYPYHFGRLSRRREWEDYDDTFRRVLRFESTFEIFCFYLGFFAFYFFFFFETFYSLVYYLVFRELCYKFYVPEWTSLCIQLIDFFIITPWFNFHHGFSFFEIDPLFIWVFSYVSLS